MARPDNQMPKGWHTIKSVLLKEIATASNFHLCRLGADALFHARLVGESVAKDLERSSNSEGGDGDSGRGRVCHMTLEAGADQP